MPFVFLGFCGLGVVGDVLLASDAEWQSEQIACRSATNAWLNFFAEAEKTLHSNYDTL
jgi:hypothetical protein